MGAALITLAALTGHLLTDCWVNGRPVFSSAFLEKFVEYVIISVSLIVMAVP